MARLAGGGHRADRGVGGEIISRYRVANVAKEREVNCGSPALLT